MAYIANNVARKTPMFPTTGKNYLKIMYLGRT
jgi:hypothetical protein